MYGNSAILSPYLTTVVVLVLLDEAARAITITSTRNAITAIDISNQVFESLGVTGPSVVVVEVEE